jgi:hypothetical protein
VRKTWFFADKGVIIETRDCVDFATRVRYPITAFKVRGTFATHGLKLRQELTPQEQAKAEELSGIIRSYFEKEVKGR